MILHVSPVNVRLALFGALLSVVAQAHCQSTATAAPSLTMQGPAETNGSPTLRDPLGRPCLDVEAAARAQVVNQSMLDHIVSLKNNCVRQIKAKVCYYNSDHCQDVVLQAYKRVDITLGSMRGVSVFRYSVTQK